MQKLGGKKIRIIDKNGQEVPDLASLPGAVIPPREPLLKGSHLYTTRTDLAMVKNWVGLEEKIVHDYKERKTIRVRPPAFLSGIPDGYFQAPAFETFSTQTTASLFSDPSEIKTPVWDFKKFFPPINEFLRILGWFVAAGLLFLYLQGILARQDVVRQFSELQNEKTQLGKSYAELEKVAALQAAEIKWLNFRLREMDEAFTSFKNERMAYDRGIEKKSREEIIRLTVQYEMRLDALRNTVRVRDAIASTLQAQTQMLQNMINQARMAAISGIASRFFKSPPLAAGILKPQGRVTQVNGRYGFIVIDLGNEQGARADREIVISRQGIVFAGGRIDRVYPTTSVVTIHDMNMLPAIHEGDTISFS